MGPSPQVTEIQTRGLLRGTRFTDAWFVSRWSMNLYRGCRHGCLYCDGRAEKYYVKGDFARDIQEQATKQVADRRPPQIVARVSRRSARPVLRCGGRGRRAFSTLTESAASRDGRSRDCWAAVDSGFCRLLQIKVNALDVLDAELSRLREPGFVFVGGGVSDAWQPAEVRHRLARGALERLHAHGMPVHVLSKSALVERDLDLLQAIHQEKHAILSMSIQTTDDTLRQVYKPGAAPLARRWSLLERAKRLGLTTGVMAMPILPGLSDSPSAIEELVARAADHGVDFLLFGGLTLRPGIQQQTWLDALRQHHPHLLPGHARLYGAKRPSGAGDPRYQQRLLHRFATALARHGLPSRIPRAIFTGLIPQYTELAMLLEHRTHRASLAGDPQPAWAGSGQALQRWAAQRWRQSGRRRSFHHQELEREPRAAVKDGSIIRRAGLSPLVLPVLRELLQSLPPSPGQMGLDFA